MTRPTSESALARFTIQRALWRDLLLCVGHRQLQGRQAGRRSASQSASHPVIYSCVLASGYRYLQLDGRPASLPAIQRVRATKVHRSRSVAPLAHRFATCSKHGRVGRSSLSALVGPLLRSASWALRRRSSVGHGAYTCHVIHYGLCQSCPTRRQRRRSSTKLHVDHAPSLVPRRGVKVFGGNTDAKTMIACAAVQP